MKEHPSQEIHHGTEVWVNPTTENVRRVECLCFNCKNSKPGQPDNCPIAQSFYHLCVKENVAMTVTRCPAWKPKS